MFDFCVRYRTRTQWIKAKSVHQAKIRASAAFPECKGSWTLANGFTWRKGGSLYLLLPSERRNIDRN